MNTHPHFVTNLNFFKSSINGFKVNKLSTKVNESFRMG